MGLLSFNLPRKILLVAGVLIALSGSPLSGSSFISTANAATTVKPLQDVKRCYGTKTAIDWATCQGKYQQNIETSCGVSLDSTDMDRRDRAKVPHNAVGGWFLAGPKATSVGGSFLTDTGDISNAYNGFFSANTARKWRKWSMHKYLFWGEVLIAIGILLLIDLIVHITPVLMCKYYRRCCCRRAYERKRSHATCMMITVIVCLVLAAFFIAISVLYSMWMKSDVDGMQCSPQVNMYEVAFDGINQDGKGFAGLQDLHTRLGAAGSDIDSITQSFSAMQLEWFGITPLAALMETNYWLGGDESSPTVDQSYVWVVGDQTALGASLCHQIKYTNSTPYPTYPLSDISLGNDNFMEDKIKDAKQMFGDAQSGIGTGFVTLNDEVYDTLLRQQVLEPLRNNTRAVDLTWIGLLCVSSLPFIGLVAATVFFVYYRVQEDHTQLRKTGCSRRMAAFFIWGYAFWAFILFIICGGLLVVLYWPSDACGWLGKQLELDGNDFRKVFPNIALGAELIDACMAKDADGDLLKQYNINETMFHFDVDAQQITNDTIGNMHTAARAAENSGWTIGGRSDAPFASTNVFHEAVISVLPDGTIDILGLQKAWIEAWSGFGFQNAGCDVQNIHNDLCIKGLSWGGSNCQATIDYTSMKRDESLDTTKDKFSGKDDLSQLVDNSDVKKWIQNCAPNDRIMAEENVYAAVLKSIILNGGLISNNTKNSPPSTKIPSDGCTGTCKPTLMFDLSKNNTRGVDFEEWAKSGLQNIIDVTQTSAIYREKVQQYLESENGPVTRGNKVIKDIAQGTNCLPVKAAVTKSRDRLCNGVFGSAAVIFYCLLGLAFLHVLAWAVLLHYWKARQTYVDALKENQTGEVVGEAPVNRTKGAPSISEDAFLLAAERGGMHDVRLGCKTYPPNTVRDLFYSNSPLHLAAFYGHEEVADYLLKEGYDPNALNYHSYTPFAACCSNRELLWPSKGNLLINMKDHGAQTEIYDYQGDTPLMSATRARDYNTVKCLLDLGANPLCKDTILLQDSVAIAESKNDPELMRLLSAASPHHVPAMGAFEGSPKSAV